MSLYRKFEYSAVYVQIGIHHRITSVTGNMIVIKKDFDNLVEIFNHVGEDGWEFCYQQESNLVFKRELLN